MTDLDLERVQSAEAETLFDAVRPFFAGHSPQVVGVALAELTALWLAGHQWPLQTPRDIIDGFRAEMMRLQTVTILELTPLMEAEFIAPMRQ
jgi:hypothetical protein